MLKRHWVRIEFASPFQVLMGLFLILAESMSTAQLLPMPTMALNIQASSDVGSDVDPVIVTDNHGHWVTVWISAENLHGTAGTDYDIFVARSVDGGATWTEPALLNSTGNSDGATQDGPADLASDEQGNWVAVWPSGTVSLTTNFDIFVARSSDNGATWSPPALLNSTGTIDGAALDTSPKIATNGAGHWVVAWLSSYDLNGAIGNDLDIFVSRSLDNGVTWTPVEILNTSAATDSNAGDRGLNLMTDRQGTWLATWNSSFGYDHVPGNDLDSLYARSTDNGATWTDPALLNTTGTYDGTADDLGARVSTDDSGNWVALWMSTLDLVDLTANFDYDIFVARSSDNAQTWSAPELLNSTGNGDSGLIDDVFPQIQSDGHGNWVAIWGSTYDLLNAVGTDLDIFYSFSIDSGTNWTAAQLLNSTGTSDGGSGDWMQQLATDGAGQWVAVWYSNYNLNNTIGTDYDIFTTHFFIEPQENLFPLATLPFALALLIAAVFVLSCDARLALLVLMGRIVTACGTTLKS